MPAGDRGGVWADEPHHSDVGTLLAGVQRPGDHAADDSDDRLRTRNPRLTSPQPEAHSTGILQQTNSFCRIESTGYQRVMHADRSSLVWHEDALIHLPFMCGKAHVLSHIPDVPRSLFLLACS